ncbi:peptidoglycan-binding protein [Oscillatoriales cyanobacterium USR001]|nr:peptidoglycan-binding protein [Oscillatoriales cyanobacterium USR001]
MSTKTINYLGPQQIAVNQSIVLVGMFDPNLVSTISLVAEEKYPLPIALNLKAGIWYSSLEKGLNQTGIRNLRLKASNKTGQIVSSQVIKITVTNATSNQPIINAITLRETLFKAKPTDGNTLTQQQKITVPVGQAYQLNSYEFANGHLKVELKNAVSPVGKIGYFYEPHIVITKGAKILSFETADLPTTPPGTQLLWINQTTKLKLYPEDSSSLSPTQQVEIGQGETYIILGYACFENHFRVTLNQAIPNFGNSGYLYYPHVQILQEGKTIPFNQNAFNLTILNTTAFKKQPIDAARLKPEERTTLPAGMIYGVSGYSLEDGHIKVSLTENIPNFGNTGYVYPDFVQLSRGGKLFNPTPSLTYTGPREVLVNQPVQLTGTFDRREASKITVLAEDKYPLNVTVNSTAGTWQINLPKGFSAVGSRWLRLKSTNSKGNITGSQIVYITVSSDPLTVGQSLQLKVLKDTFFKVAPIDSSLLNQTQKVLVSAGQNLTVLKYGLVDGHLKVLLNTSILPIGTFGYFYEPAVQLSKGSKTLKFDIEDIPDTHLTAQMLVTRTTQIKISPNDSSNLAKNQSAELILGSTYPITGYACTAGHFRVTLGESIPGFGNVGYIYWQHILIKRDGQVVTFDTDALTMTMMQTTVFKKQPVDANNLSDSQKVTLPLGRVYGVESYGVDGEHLKVSLTEELPNFGNTGYVFPSYVVFKRGDKTFDPIPNYVELNVPYFSQRDNPRFYWSTCNVTAIAMVLYYYGARSKGDGDFVDELLQWCFNYGGQGSQTDHSVLSAMIKAYGFKTSFSTTRRWSDIKSELINRRPVVLAGNFTATGHILTAIGYDSVGYIVQDPWGNALTGYSDTEGRKLLYSYGYLDQVAGPDGNIWAHFISR